MTLPPDRPLHEYHLRLGSHEWTLAHSGAMLSDEDEQRYLGEERSRAPYGIVLWPAALALAHELESRAGELAGKHVLELGAGVGLPGIVAATYGARVVQTDRHDGALALGQLNARRNGAHAIEHRLADWTEWSDTQRYDIILGADILYASRLHPSLRAIFEYNLAPAGQLLLSDPFRPASLELLEAMQRDGWRVTLTKWTLEGEWGERAVGGYQLERPRLVPGT